MLGLVLACVSVLPSTVASAQEPTGSARSPASDATAPASLVERVVAAEADVRDGETDLVAQARAALDEAEARRARADEPGALRAERIAEAALGLVAARRARSDSVAALETTRARRAEIGARLEAARTARAAAERERARLGGTVAP